MQRTSKLLVSLLRSSRPIFGHYSLSTPTAARIPEIPFPTDPNKIAEYGDQLDQAHPGHEWRVRGLTMAFAGLWSNVRLELTSDPEQARMVSLREYCKPDFRERVNATLETFPSGLSEKLHAAGLDWNERAAICIWTGPFMCVTGLLGNAMAMAASGQPGALRACAPFARSLESAAIKLASDRYFSYDGRDPLYRGIDAGPNYRWQFPSGLPDAGQTVELGSLLATSPNKFDSFMRSACSQVRYARDGLELRIDVQPGTGADLREVKPATGHSGGAPEVLVPHLNSGLEITAIGTDETQQQVPNVAWRERRSVKFAVVAGRSCPVSPKSLATFEHIVGPVPAYQASPQPRMPVSTPTPGAARH